MRPQTARIASNPPFPCFVPMKLKPIIIIASIVVIIHLLLFCFLVLPHQRKNQEPEPDAPTAKTEVTNAPAPSPAAPGPAEPSVPTSPGVATPEAQPAEMPRLPLYSPEFFTRDLRPLPQKIASKVNCRSGCVIDLDTRRLFWELSPTTPYPIASVTKMMTAYLAVKTMRESNGAITLQTPVKVSVNASHIGGRRVWLDPKETFTFDELLKCVLVHSANDAAYLLGEFCAGGSAPAFVAQMNEQAKAMGCNSMVFLNTNGLPENKGKDQNLACALELAYLSLHLLNIPEIMKWTGVKKEYLRENDEAFIKRNKGGATMLSSSNTLLGRCPGVNGMKTGYTDKAGYCVVITCERNNRRMGVVILSSPTAKERDALATALVEWAYTQK
ncbi:MAG: D-alanyl-D-alanine carboxypeptidase [Victivallales bacterium]|nr:D-alanyl-D-alanine carboxypeptidase [Victivallales bacterium]